jgi:predicted transcriptional regulator
MARAASENSPSDGHVKEAVQNIEETYRKLDTERAVYMNKCKAVRAEMKDHYSDAGNLGISKKLLAKIIKERQLERKIDALTADLEPDERSELEMLIEKLGDFGGTPLGQAALAKADGAATLAQAGA